MSFSIPSRYRPLALVASLAFLMVAVTYASPVLYRLFCEVTGYGGTPQIGMSEEIKTSQTMAARHGSDAIPEHAHHTGHSAALPDLQARLVGDVQADLSWDFAPDQTLHVLPIGEEIRMTFTAHNRSNEPRGGTSTFNVLPASAATYVHKLECFCLTEHVLQGNETVTMPFVVYINPAIMNDELTQDVETITFAYRFFASDEK
ncbi:MAG: cytochrome c oxidase assembly protein [Pseudomonadota bacterium]